MATVARSPHPPVWCVWLLILTAMWMPIAPAAANTLPRLADFGSSSETRSEALCIYLYAHGNPVSNIDPSGNVSLIEAKVVTSIAMTLNFMAVSSARNTLQMASGIFSPDGATAEAVDNVIFGAQVVETVSAIVAISQVTYATVIYGPKLVQSALNMTQLSASKIFQLLLGAANRFRNATARNTAELQVVVGSAETNAYRTVFRGERAGVNIIKSHAAREGGYAHSESLIRNGDIDKLMMAHAENSASPPSPFISVTSNPDVARFFAGPGGVVHELRIPASRAIPNPHNNMLVPGPNGVMIPESEYLVPSYIRLTEMIRTLTN